MVVLVLVGQGFPGEEGVPQGDGGGVVVEDGGDVVLREGVGGVGDQEGCFPDCPVAHYDCFDLSHVFAVLLESRVEERSVCVCLFVLLIYVWWFV